MWDELQPGVGAKREHDLKDRHWKDLLNKGAKVKRFDRSTRSAWEIIGEMVGQQLADEAELMQKDLLEQLRKDRKGQRFHSTLQDLLDEEKKLMKELHNEAESQETSALASNLEEVRKQLSETINQVQSLKSPLGKTIAQFFG